MRIHHLYTDASGQSHFRDIEVEWVEERRGSKLSKRLQATGTPKSLDHKFITEDVPTGLIPMSALGRAAGVRTPAIDALVELVRKMTGKDFAADARTLERLELSGMDAPQVRRVMDEGFS